MKQLINKRKPFFLSASQKIAFTFLVVIAIGTFLLMLPVSNQNHEILNFIDALFTATSATCVTGLVTVVPAQQFTKFGQSVLIVLFELGGLGLMTFMAVLVLFVRQKLALNDKKAMKELLNQSSVINIKKFIREIILYSFIFEGIGTILLSIRFIPKLGWKEGIFRSIFLSVSAFCNAGFDNIGSTSLIELHNDALVLLVIAGLIITGGLGFAVWFELRDSLIPYLRKEVSFKKVKRSLHSHTKIVLSMTFGLVVVPAIIIFLIESNNPATMGEWPLHEKILASIFEAVTLRTAGFASIPYSNILLPTCFMMLFVMFIGGSPGGTAGGVKTTTIAVCYAYIKSLIQGKEQTIMFHRIIPQETIIRALSLVAINMAVLVISIFLLCLVDTHEFMELTFEAVSAMATVGLSLGITSQLTAAAKIIVIMLMFIGRIGIFTLLMSLSRKNKMKKQMNVSYPQGNVIVG